MTILTRCNFNIIIMKILKKTKTIKSAQSEYTGLKIKEMCKWGEQVGLRLRLCWVWTMWSCWLDCAWMCSSNMGWLACTAAVRGLARPMRGRGPQPEKGGVLTLGRRGSPTPRGGVPVPPQVGLTGEAAWQTNNWRRVGSDLEHRRSSAARLSSQFTGQSTSKVSPTVISFGSWLK